jgi:hypothetical protein
MMRKLPRLVQIGSQPLLPPHLFPSLVCLFSVPIASRQQRPTQGCQGAVYNQELLRHADRQSFMSSLFALRSISPLYAQTCNRGATIIHISTQLNTDNCPVPALFSTH